MENNTCYMCNAVATSREHIPPLCLFPEIKDTKGINFRKNLITVPSCDIHNSKKSDDDEFLMLSLSGLLKNNYVGNFHQLTKANRALRRKNQDFINKEILRNYREHKITTSEGKCRTIFIGVPNVQRLHNSLKYIAYGLHLHEFNHKFEGEVHVILEFVEYTDENTRTFIAFLKERFKSEDNLNLPLRGDNPFVFHYQFHKADKMGIIGLRMVFYGTAEVYLAFRPRDVKEPFDLGLMLMNEGVTTTITLNDKEYVFNKRGGKD